MSDHEARIAGLSAEKRALLELRLMGNDAPVAEEPGITRREASCLYPVSFAQERMWFLDQWQPDSPVYNLSSAIRLRGRLDVEALERSLNEVVRRHESLRTTFAVVDGQPIQVIAPAMMLALPVVELGEGAEGERQAEAMRLATGEARRPFDLAHGPLLRARLLRLGEEDHIFLLMMHHIVSDGWSIGVFLSELSMLYEAFCAGRSSSLRELPIQYADFAVWQREWLQGEVLEEQLSYWRQQLAGSPALLSLPTDRPRSPVQTFRGARQSSVLPNTLSESLKVISREEGATLFMTLLAALQVLLFRYSGQEDIVVGTPIANRNRAEIEGLIGFFVNTLVMRSDLSGSPTFRELLRQVREVCLDAYDHQDLPFEKLVQELQPERNLSHSPLFQVMLAFQNVTRRETEFPGLQARRLRVDSGTAKFDLWLEIIEEADGLRVDFVYNADLFDATTIERMVGHYRTLLDGIARNPDQPIAVLPLLTGAEKVQMLVEWNDTRVAYPEDLCIHQLFEAQAARTPEAVAVLFEGQRLTYRDLNERANQLAHYLRERGVGPEILVGICVERSLDMVVGLLGILKAGGAYVPLDPSHPRARLGFALEDAGVSMLITQGHLVSDVAQYRVKTVDLDTEWAWIARKSVETPTSEGMGGNLAYVAYTSGSAGRPKGVAIPHRSVANLLVDLGQKVGLTDNDLLVAITTLSFDIAALELFLPLTMGACVAIVTRETALDGGRLGWKMADLNGTIMQATPASWQLLLESGWRGSEQLKVLSGGDLMTRELANQLLARGTDVWNLYGPTETTIYSTRSKVDSRDGPVPIGRPVANTQIHLLDAHLQPVPVGVTGELFVGGAGLARCYLNRPELTAERFVPSPFGDEPGVRLYRSGDLARYLPDGNIQFLGRLDHQVKVRGFRIELGEIEAVLASHAGVREAVAVARGTEPNGSPTGLTDKRLVAYVVPATDPPPSVTELRRYLGEELPDYMIPSIFMMLDRLPLTANRKVDRGALPAVDEARPELDEAYVAPRTPVEEELARIWSEVLKVEPVGIDDNFFELGGHSLLATVVVSRIRDAFQKNVSVRSFFGAPTISKLGAVIEKAGRHRHGSQPALTPRVSRGTGPAKRSTGSLPLIKREEV